MVERRFIKVFIGSLIILSFFQIASAKRKEIMIQSKIKEVSVFQNKALIKREAEGNFQIGKCTLVFKSLTPMLKSNSVRVSGKGFAKAKILNVQVKRAIVSNIPKEIIKKLMFQQNKIEDEIVSIKNKITALKEKRDLLKLMSSLKAKDSGINTQKRIIDLNQWKGALAFLENQLNDILSKGHNFKKLLEKKKEILSKIEAKLDIESYANKKKYKAQREVWVEIDIKKSGFLKFNLSYIASGANWNPVYDLRLGTKNNIANLEYKAFIYQETQKDWKNIQLTLSTAQPLRMLKIPEIKPIYIDAFNRGLGNVNGTVILDDGTPLPGATLMLTGSKTGIKKTVSNEDGKFLFSNVPSGNYQLKAELEGFTSYTYKGINVLPNKTNTLKISMQLSKIQECIEVTCSADVQDDMDDLETQNFQIKDYGISTEFKLLQKNTVLSNAADQLVTIRRENLPYKKRYLSIPKHAEVCFLQAKLVNNSTIPLLAGKVNVFMDNLMINTIEIPLIHSNKEFEIDLGVDEGISVKRKNLDLKSKIKGFIKKKSVQYSGYTIEVTNNKNQNIEVDIIDQIPFSKNKAIKIKINKLSPTPKKKKEGIMHWKLKLKPKEMKQIIVDYELSFPKKVKIVEY